MEFFRGSGKESGLGFLFDVPIVGYFVIFFFSKKKKKKKGIEICVTWEL